MKEEIYNPVCIYDCYRGAHVLHAGILYYRIDRDIFKQGTAVSWKIIASTENICENEIKIIFW